MYCLRTRESDIMASCASLNRPNLLLGNKYSRSLNFSKKLIIYQSNQKKISAFTSQLKQKQPMKSLTRRTWSPMKENNGKQQ